MTEMPLLRELLNLSGKWSDSERALHRVCNKSGTGYAMFGWPALFPYSAFNMRPASVDVSKAFQALAIVRLVRGSPPVRSSSAPSCGGYESAQASRRSGGGESVVRSGVDRCLRRGIASASSTTLSIIVIFMGF